MPTPWSLKLKQSKRITNVKSLFVVLSLAFSSAALASEYKPKLGDGVQLVDYDELAFEGDPDYTEHVYSADEQIKIYGGKFANGEPFYFHLLGRRMYPVGQFTEGLNILGRKNRLYPHLMAFGDLRLAYVYSEDGTDEKAEIAARMNLDIDLKLTSTERVHAFVRPFDKNGKFTRFVFGQDGVANEFQDQFDFNLDALFFEGDFGSIFTGIFDSYSKLDLPFAFGFMPILFHNGIWMNDAFIGAAFTIPAMNSAFFDISNMDVTFFTGNDEINSPISPLLNGTKIYGANAFIEAMRGYFEIGYAYTEDEDLNNGDQSYHNTAFSFSHRWKNYASLSYRLIGNFGQEALSNGEKNADGGILFIESSLVTDKPYTLIPYINVFFGVDKPKAVASQVGILNNVGILFENDGMTSFPTLDALGENTWGGAFGIEYLFNLDQQIIFEAAMVQPHAEAGSASTIDQEIGLGLRWQKPLSASLILRADAMVGLRTGQDDIWGTRTELRWKF